MKRILLIGKTGQVGQELQDTLKLLGDVVALGRSDLDLTQPESIRQSIAHIQPEIIINAAAYTAVDKAETEPELAFAINGVAPTIMAESAQKLGATLVHISTDYVFDGKHNTPYTEEDDCNPIGVYGKSKLQGELGIKTNTDRHIILRTAWVYGTRGHGNFVKTMLRLASDREEIKVVADQIGSPTYSQDIAVAITQLVSKLSFHAGIFGTYHYTNSGVASWYDFAYTIFEVAKQLDFPLKIERVVPITTSEYPTPASRPTYSVLSTQKISQTLGTFPVHWRQALVKMLTELANNQQPTINR